MFRELARSIKNAVFAAALLVSFLVVLELFRAFVFFYRLNHLLGIGFAVFLVFFLGLIGRLLLGPWLRQPRVLRPPHLPPADEASFAELKRFCRYLVQYLQRLSQNPALTPEHREQAAAAADDLQERLAAHPLRADLIRAIETCENDTLEPLLAVLRRRAEREVRDCVRDVMLGVALSPYHSVDLLVVIVRIGRLLGRISTIYLARPLPRDEWLIFRDTLRVVAAVNAFNLGRSAFREVLTNAPLIGRTAYQLGEALGAGIFTSLAGYAAIDRCAAYRGWTVEKAAEGLAAQVGTFARDLGRIFTTDLVSLFIGSAEQAAEGERTTLKQRLEEVVSGVLDSLAAVASELVRVPRSAAQRESAASPGAVAGADPVAERVVREQEPPAEKPEDHRERKQHRRSRRRRSPLSELMRLARVASQRARYGRPPR